MEAAFEPLEKGGRHIVKPIRRIWTGERDGAWLTTGLNESDTLIVREILNRLKS